MSLIIHICQDIDHAETIAATADAFSAGATSTILSEPDIIIYDYSEDPNNPRQINENKICVVFQN